MESDEQIAFVQWLRMRRIDGERIRFCHVPNEGKFPVQYRVKLKKMGLEKGVSDILIFTPPPKKPSIRIVAIEMKFGKNTLTDSQLDFLNYIDRNGGLSATAYSADEAVMLCQRLGY